MKSHRNTLARWLRRCLDVCFLALAISGGVWLSVHHAGWPVVSRAAIEGLPSPWEPWLMKLHGLAYFGMLFLAGRLSANHVMRGWRLHLRRRSGASMLAGVLLLALSGHVLAYWVPEAWRDPLGWAHAGVGVAWLGLMFAHRRRPDRHHVGGSGH